MGDYASDITRYLNNLSALGAGGLANAQNHANAVNSACYEAQGRPRLLVQLQELGGILLAAKDKVAALHCRAVPQATHPSAAGKEEICDTYADLAASLIAEATEINNTLAEICGSI